MTSIAFSQSDTTKEKHYTYPESIIKKIIKDLIRKDSLEAEVQVCKNNTNLLQENLKLKDFIISIKNEELKNKDTQIVNLTTANGLKDKQNKNLQKNVEDLSLLLKKAKKKNVTQSVVGGAIIASLTYLLLK
jgi:hypothetical protein